jgi:hypothetical protein
LSMATPEQIIELEAFDGWRGAISCDNLAATFSPELAVLNSAGATPRWHPRITRSHPRPWRSHHWSARSRIPSPRSALRIGERRPGLAIGAADSPFPVRGPLTRIPASHRSKAVQASYALEGEISLPPPGARRPRFP